MRKPFWGIVCLTLSSCNIYNSNFDCPPGKGVGCASVGEVLDLIVEREDEDLFVYDKKEALLLKEQDRLKKPEKNTSALVKPKTKLVLIQQDSGVLSLVEEVAP